jgi:hypothetical protein
MPSGEFLACLKLSLGLLKQIRVRVSDTEVKMGLSLPSLRQPDGDGLQEMILRQAILLYLQVGKTEACKSVAP